MARIIYPDDLPTWQTLLNTVKAKHDADGLSSPLHAYFAEHGIDLNASAAGSAQALTHHTSSGLLSRQSENQLQLRDNRFNPLFTRFKGMVQFLKSFYKGNPKALGDWGITVDGQSRVVYPASFDDRTKLFNTFAAKHNSFGAAGSSLKPYLQQHNIDMAAEELIVDQALKNNDTFLASSRDSETETASRNNLHHPIITLLRGIGDYLKKLYSDNAKALGAWGFTVDDSARAPKTRTTTLKAGESITINSVSIGGTFTNIGVGDLHLYKGKTTTGNPAIIHAAGQMGMLKGYTTITVVNPSTMNPGKFTVLSIQ